MKIHNIDLIKKEYQQYLSKFETPLKYKEFKKQYLAKLVHILNKRTFRLEDNEIVDIGINNFGQYVLRIDNNGDIIKRVIITDSDTIEKFINKEVGIDYVVDNSIFKIGLNLYDESIFYVYYVPEYHYKRCKSIKISHELT